MDLEKLKAMHGFMQCFEAKMIRGGSVLELYSAARRLQTGNQEEK